LKIFKSFLGFVQSSSPLKELEKLVAVLPDLVDEAKSGNYSPELLCNYVLQQLIGPELQIVKCDSCQTRFNVDKQPQTVGYHCPRCLSSDTVVDKNTLDILKKVLYTPKVLPKFEVHLISLPPGKSEPKE